MDCLRQWVEHGTVSEPSYLDPTFAEAFLAQQTLGWYNYSLVLEHFSGRIVNNVIMSPWVDDPLGDDGLLPFSINL